MISGLKWVDHQVRVSLEKPPSSARRVHQGRRDCLAPRSTRVRIVREQERAWPSIAGREIKPELHVPRP